MRLIRASYEIVSITNNALNVIEQCARTCYQSITKMDETTTKPFVQMLIDKHHEAMLEFADMIVVFTIPRSLSHELVRHRLASVAQEST